jgi:hypothetical protein
LTGVTRQWRTPDAPNAGGPRNRQTSIGKGHQVTIAEQAEHWPTPAARDYKGENGEAHLDAGTGRKHLDQLPNYVAHCWPTPTATPYGSSQNGINGIGGANERPSANTPSLEGLSRSFLPGPPTSTLGAGSSPSTPSSPRPLLSSAKAVKAKLNPAFVGWLMGFPPAWTNCGPTATEFAHYKRRMRFALSQLGS